VKRSTACLIVAALAVSLNAAVPAAAGERAPASPSSQLPKRKLVKQMPSFASQPRIVKASGGWQIEADVRLTPWRTLNGNTRALWDKVGYHVQVAKKGQAIRTVSLAPKDQKGLLLKKRLKPVVVKQSGRYTIAFPVTRKVAATLSGQSRRQQQQRIRVTIEHHKDVRRTIRGRDVTQVVQSGASRTPTAQGSQLSSNAENTVTFWLYNYTPFDSEVSFQATQCMSDTSWSGSINSGATWMVNGWIDNTGQNGVFSQSDSQNLSQGAVSALQSSATQASQNAIDSGASLFTPTGAVSAAVGWAGDFLVDFLQNLSANSCKNLPTLYTTSLVAESVGNDSTTAAYGFNSSENVLAPVAPTLPPTSTMINSTVGAQTSTQWHWNDNNPQPASNGAFNWAGGLISMAPQSNSYEADGYLSYNTNVAWYYVSDGGNQTGMGPEPNVWPASANDPDAPSLTANWNGNSMILTCDPGQWSVSNPWADSLALSPPPNSNQYSANQAYLSWAYNGTLNGKPVYGQPFPDVPAVTKFATTPQQQQITSEVLAGLPEGTEITQWVCTVSAAVQVQSWDVPSGWPSGLGGTPNGSWWSAPNVVVSAPYVPAP
jgi:hypothetical protein